jgi:lipopolysaccharide transport system ATP-binding protein
MSSNNIAIKVENLSKRYRIGIKKNSHDSIGGAMFEFIKNPLSNYRKYRSLYKFDNIAPDQNDRQVDDDPSPTMTLMR